MRVIRNAKPVSIVAGSTLVLAGGLGIWLAAMVPAGPENGRRVVLTVFTAAVALIRGVVILLWDRRSKPVLLMRSQVADALPAILPLAAVSSPVLAAPGFSDPANPSLWIGGLLLASAAVSVLPAEKAALAEIPPLRPGHFLDWLRWQNFGAGSLWVSGFFTAMFFFDSRRFDAFTPLVIVLALAQAILSVWRIIEQGRFSRVGPRLSGLQINWLRVIHVSRGHEAAVKELRTMYPKIGPSQADIIIENLYRAEALSGPDRAGSRRAALG